MKQAATRFATALLLVPVSSENALAHALAQRYDLPLPLSYFLFGCGAVVAVTFIIFAIFFRKHRNLAKASDGVILTVPIPSILVASLQTLSIAALTLLVIAGLFGNPSTFKNITPVSVWVIWWVGFGFLAAFVGNLWPLINPWVVAFNLAQTVTRRWFKVLSFHLSYPPWLAVWPSCLLFLLFAWLELVAPARDVPRNIAIAILAYSFLTWTGFGAFGRDTWLKNGEVFSLAFGLFGRFAPLNFTHGDRYYVSVRPWAEGLVTRTPLNASMTAFALLMLGTVTVDGLMETPQWAAFVTWALKGSSADGNQVRYMLLQTSLLIAGPIMLAALYLLATTVMARVSRASFKDMSGLFALSLVPIAIAYHLAHYFSLFAIAGQFIIPLASDPFGYGWDLFGTTLYRIDIGIVDAKSIWYISVAAIVTGHMIAVWVGHVTAVTAFVDENIATRSQYPMLVLMVGYTMLSLWILAQPIVEPSAK
jgi:hypothetical protein